MAGECDDFELARLRHIQALREQLVRYPSAVPDHRLASPNQVSGRWPDFLVIGAQKAGTTWLYQMLDGHPFIWLPPIKEINYFNQVYFPSSVGWEEQGREDQLVAAEAYFESTQLDDLVSRSRRAAIAAIRAKPISDSWYSSIFKFAGVDMVCGEVCPDYGLLPREAIVNVYRNNPSIKIALIVRDPVDRAWSHLSMASHPRFGGASIRDLIETDWWSFSIRSNYPAIMQRWLSIIPRENFLLLDFDDIPNKPEAVAQQMCALLGVPYDARYFWRLSSVGFGGDAVEKGAEIDALLRSRLRFIYEEMLNCSPEIGRRWFERRFGEIGS